MLHVIVLSALPWRLHLLLIAAVRPPVILNDGLICVLKEISVPPSFKWKLMRKTKVCVCVCVCALVFLVFFPRPCAPLLYQSAHRDSSERMNRITFQSKAQVPNCCGKLFFRLHNALTRVCFILAPRLDVISTPTAPHRIADEIKLLTKERMCSALSSALVLFIPSLAFKCLDGYFKCEPSLINANRGRKNIKVVIVMNVCMYEWF